MWKYHCYNNIPLCWGAITMMNMDIPFAILLDHVTWSRPCKKQLDCKWTPAPSSICFEFLNFISLFPLSIDSYTVFFSQPAFAGSLEKNCLYWSFLSLGPQRRFLRALAALMLSQTISNMSAKLEVNLSDKFCIMYLQLEM